MLFWDFSENNVPSWGLLKYFSKTWYISTYFFNSISISSFYLVVLSSLNVIVSTSCFLLYSNSSNAFLWAAWSLLSLSRMLSERVPISLEWDYCSLLSLSSNMAIVFLSESISTFNRPSFPLFYSVWRDSLSVSSSNLTFASFNFLLN